MENRIEKDRLSRRSSFTRVEWSFHMPKPAALLFFAFSALYAAAIPRPEYPQPQFQREHWLSLNGAWEFEFDDANAGLDADWASGNQQIQPEHHRAVLF